LIDKARGGDAAALGKLLESIATYLNLLASVQIGRRLQGKVDASDIVQETFLEAHRQITNFRGGSEGELLAWLRRILAGQIALTLRKYLGTKGRDVRMERELVAQLDESSHALGAQLAASASTPSQHASRRLPADYRQVIVLRHIETLTFPEVAVRMERSEDSVQKLWVRALGSLRRALGES